jgi:hypothetical protein
MRGAGGAGVAVTVDECSRRADAGARRGRRVLVATKPSSTLGRFGASPEACQV